MRISKTNVAMGGVIVAIAAAATAHDAESAAYILFWSGLIGLPTLAAFSMKTPSGAAAGAPTTALIFLATCGVHLPCLLTALQRAAQKRTMRDIRQIAAVLQSTEAKTPISLTSVEQLASHSKRALPLRDGWNEPYVLKASGTSYVLISAGKDRKAEGSTVWSAPPEATTNFDCDIVYRDGTFVRYPEGVESVQ